MYPAQKFTTRTVTSQGLTCTRLWSSRQKLDPGWWNQFRPWWSRSTVPFPHSSHYSLSSSHPETCTLGGTNKSSFQACCRSFLRMSVLYARQTNFCRLSWLKCNLRGLNQICVVWIFQIFITSHHFAWQNIHFSFLNWFFIFFKLEFIFFHLYLNGLKICCTALKTALELLSYLLVLFLGFFDAEYRIFRHWQVNVIQCCCLTLNSLTPTNTCSCFFFFFFFFHVPKHKIFCGLRMIILLFSFHFLTVKAQIPLLQLWSIH